jgi:hypothetical protein
MKSPIDLKSFAFGALIAVLVALSIAAATGPSPGRFQISSWGFGATGRSGHGAYVVDTATGEVWVIHEGGMQRKLVDKLK